MIWTPLKIQKAAKTASRILKKVFISALPFYLSSYSVFCFYCTNNAAKNQGKLKKTTKRFQFGCKGIAIKGGLQINSEFLRNIQKNS